MALTKTHIGIAILAIWGFLTGRICGSTLSWQALERAPFRVYHKATQTEKAKLILDHLATIAPTWLDYFEGTSSQPDIYGVTPYKENTRWITLVLDDEGYVANGWVNFSKDELVFLHALPDTRFFLQWGSYWQLLVTHEISHYGQLAMERTPKDPISWILNPILTPNKSLPLPLLEGTAVWAESKDGTYGRLHDGYTSALVMQQIHHGNAPSLGALRYPYYDFPYDTAPYLYGGKFTDYLVSRNNAEALREMYAHHAGHVLGATMGYIAPNFGIDAASNHVYGKTMPELFETWKATEKSQIPPSSNWTRQTYSGGYKQFLSRHREHIYYVKTSYRHPAPFAFMQARYDVIQWTPQGEEIVYRSQLPIVGMQFSGNNMVLLCEDLTSGVDNHRNLGYGKTRILKSISMKNSKETLLASGPISSFTLKEGQVFYTLPSNNGRDTTLWGILNDIPEYLGTLPIYVSEMVPFQRHLALIAKTPNGPWQLFSLQLETMVLTQHTHSDMAVAHVWGDGETLYLTINHPTGYRLHQFRHTTGIVEQLTDTGHATYGVPSGNQLLVLGLTATGEELFTLPLAPKETPIRTTKPAIGTEKHNALPNYDAIATNLDSLLPHKPSFRKSIGVFGEDSLAWVSYHLGYDHGLDLQVTSHILSPVAVSGRFSSAGNEATLSWSFFQSWQPGLTNSYTALTYRWDKWVGSLGTVWTWFDTQLSGTGEVGLQEGYGLMTHLSQGIGDGTIGLRMETRHRLDREERRRGHASEHQTNTSGSKTEAYLLHRLFPLRTGFWSPNIFIGDSFIEVYAGTQSFNPSGGYFGLEWQVEGHAFGGLRFRPYIGTARYTDDTEIYGGIDLSL